MFLFSDYASHLQSRKRGEFYWLHSFCLFICLSVHLCQSRYFMFWGHTDQRSRFHENFVRKCNPSFISENNFVARSWWGLFITFSDSSSVMRCFFNPFPNKPWFLRVCSTNLLKTLWVKEKLLITSNFSFSHSVFLHLRRTFHHFHQI